MANLSSIARPYASALFQVAREKNELALWDNFLKTATTIANDAKVVLLLNNPEVDATKTFELFQGILASRLTKEQKNFLLLLAQNKRFLALGEITKLFEDYLRALEKISQVRLITAVPVSDEYKEKLSQALSNRMKHQVILNNEIDTSILGGAIIHMGDQVIDGSIRGKLSRLLTTLTG